MRSKAAKATRSKREGQHDPDPRLAAFARLLARDMAQKHFEKELKAARTCGYDSEAPSEEKS